jgi:phage tail-like protein
VQDVNGTRFHLMLGEADWLRARTTQGESAFPGEQSPPPVVPPRVQFNGTTAEVTLWKDTFRFPGGHGERLSPESRRGAARDRFGNWYWISPDRQSVLVWSCGSRNTSVFWPADDVACAAADIAGDFRPREATASKTAIFQGLTITHDHYLVVGTIASGESAAGLLVFDLYATGEPRHRRWPKDFEPFDLDAREGGGVWVLDRAHRRVWEVDRRFEIVVSDPTHAAASPSAFANADGSVSTDIVARTSIDVAQGWPLAALDPIGITAHPRGGVLVLDRSGSDGFARVHWLVDGQGRGGPASTGVMAARVAPAETGSPFTLIAHDFAFGSRLCGDPDAWAGRLYVVAVDGNQAYAFGVTEQDGHLHLEAQAEYYPMRLFGGRALASAGGDPWYDCGDTWVRLVAQDRPRYAEEGEVWTPVFDSGEAACVWHRLMLDGCIAPGTSVDVFTRASDDWRELILTDWLSPLERDALGAPVFPEPGDPTSEDELVEWQQEPSPHLRPNGSELPYLPGDDSAYRGTWELLFQRARGRYLQVRLVLRGDGRSTPRIRALRLWYPRFSYLDRYLPAVYREDAPSSSFLDRFLANFEGTFTTIENRIAAAQMLFDAATAPPDALDWLGRWFGVAFDPSWDESRRRLFLRHAVDFFALRGTVRGLQLALRLALDECVDDTVFEQPARNARGAAPVRMIERFRSRRTPRALVGDVSIGVPGPRPIDPAARWEPASGAAELHRRYRAALTLPAGTEFPLGSAGAPAGWQSFAADTLGFVPRASETDRSKWQRFLQGRYSSVAALNVKHAAAWPSFDAVRLPSDRPSAAAIADWNAFLDEVPSRQRRLWHDFLARRYRTAAALNAAWRTHWPAIASVPLPDRVPTDNIPLSDWFQFEGTALAMHRTAHRFSVLLPIPRHLRSDTPAQQRRVALAALVLDLEKPAHTTYDLRFYWAMFRLGEARLGDDTLIDYGSRAPELMGPMVLGQDYLGEAFLAPAAGADAPERLAIGRDRIGRSTRVGGP